MSTFTERLQAAIDRVGAPTCVGLDPHLDRLPAALRAQFADLQGTARREAAAAAVLTFFSGVLEAVDGLTPSIKPQVAFFEALGAPGVAALETLVADAKRRGLVVVLDAKRGDIGSTAEAYAHGTLDDDGPLGADAVTLSPYLGPESMAPFLKRCPEKGLFVLVRTSNPGAGAWQAEGAEPVAHRVADWVQECSAALGQGGLGPVGAVVGATVPREAGEFRARMPQAWILVPGYGAQGATAADTLPNFTPARTGALVVSARGVLFGKGTDGDDWREQVATRARDLRDDIRSVIVG